MANKSQTKEAMDKLSALVRKNFAGDFSNAFRHYADRDLKVGNSGLNVLLVDARIGSLWTRWAWAAAIMLELDADGDGRISWLEFKIAFNRQGGRAGIRLRPTAQAKRRR